MVAGVYQQDVLAVVLIALFQSSNGGVGQLRALLVNVGVDIVGVQNGNVLHIAGPAGRRSGCAQCHGGSGGGHTGSLHKAAAGDKIFHRETTSFYSGCYQQASSGPALIAFSITQNPAAGKQKSSFPTKKI